MKRIPLCVVLLLSTITVCGDESAELTPKTDGEFVIGPDYTKASELTVKEGVPKGTVHELTMKSEDSKIYPGLKGPYTRGVHVYVPSQYVAGTAAPFIVVQDGKGQLQRLPPILDNLIAEKRVPAMVAIMVDNGGGDGKGSERGLEYDTVSGKYAEFIESEVLPLVEKECNVKLTKDPDGRATLGGSSGAAAAFTMAWFHPEWYHRVISYSGTFVAQQSPDSPETPHGAWEYHEHLIPQSQVKPIRIWFHVSENDNRANDPESTYHNWVLANQRMLQVLKDKGYHYQYVFAKKAGHTDRKVYDQTLPEALEWVWQGYSASDDDLKKGLIGTWTTEPNETTATISTATYNADGTGTETVREANQPESGVIRVDTQWALKSGVLTIKSVKSSNEQRIPIGIELKDKIISLTPDKLTFETLDWYGDGNGKQSVKLRQK